MSPSSQQEKEELELKALERALLSHCGSPSASAPAPPALSLPYHVSSSIRGRSSHIYASPPSCSSSSTIGSCHTSPWAEPIDTDPAPLPSINPSDLTKTLLYQLASSISAMTRAFAHLRATLHAYSSAAEDGSGDVTAAAEEEERVMAEELQRLSSVHTRLYALLQEQGGGIMSTEESSGGCGCECRQESAMLRSYEGIISRFHDEIRKKEAVVEALKDTLAKSLLNVEKLQRRVKSLEAKLS